MADQPKPLSDRPVLAGLVALTGVAVVVGLLAGVAVLAGSRVLGFNDAEVDGSSGSPTAGETLYLPDPVATTGPAGPRITLDVDPEQQAAAEAQDVNQEEEKKAKKEKEKDEFKLTAAQTSVPAMGRIDLTGSYPRGDGAILRVQRKVDGAWTDFPVTMSVRGGTYTTYVVTGQSGKTKFRVIDTDSGKASNVVEVTIG